MKSCKPKAATIHRAIQGNLFTSPTRASCNDGLFLSLWKLKNSESQQAGLNNPLGRKDAVYALFANPARAGVLYADSGAVQNQRELVILSDTEPLQPQTGNLDTVILPPGHFAPSERPFRLMASPVQPASHPDENFEKIACEWFEHLAPACGFTLKNYEYTLPPPETLLLDGRKTILRTISLRGALQITNSILFAQSIRSGLGANLEWGCGLMLME